ncbi:MAG: cadmium-translocating P-type ATPase [Clostridiales bacterium]|nr:cadmium-translocating P-type ATPase [Clostridiales bacterium]MBD8959467.1 cadmium-translocating P-type ATPase [Clostridiales bacterium]
MKDEEKKNACPCCAHDRDAHEHEHEHEHEHDGCCCGHDNGHHHDHDDDDDGCCCGHDHEHEEGDGKDLLIRLVIAAVLFCVGLALNFLALPTFVPAIVFGVAYLVAGYRVLLEAWEGIRKGDWFGEEFLMSIASLGAFAIGEFAESCAVVILFELGEYLQGRAVAKSRGSIKQMLALRPEKVTVEKDKRLVTVAPEDVQIGDIVVVAPGEKVSLDGVLVEGTGDMDLSALTGESLPVSKTVGDEALSGSMSVDATFKVRVTADYANGTVAKILEMLEHARERKSPVENFIRRFSKVYTPIVCAFAALVAVVPPLVGLGSFSTWVYRALCALAASCPCALVISVPLGLFGGLGAASKCGVLIKGGNYLEALTTVNAAAFDKTGTLTRGSFAYVGAKNAPDETALCRVVAICEKYSTHPIALAAMRAFGNLAEGIEITDSAAVPGKGVRADAVIGGRAVACLCGNASLLRDAGIAFDEAETVGTVVYAAADGVYLGCAVFADELKADSADALRDLAALGITDTTMLTGDKRAIAERVAKEVGISAVKPELLPADKVAAISALRESGKKLVYVGDGINDAPGLALADVGVAMGGIGSAAALEAADVVIMGDSLKKLPAVIRIARKTMRIVRENIVFALVVKVGVVILSAFGLTDLWIAVLADVGVCLLAVANALRTMQVREK